MKQVFRGRLISLAGAGAGAVWIGGLGSLWLSLSPAFALALFFENVLLSVGCVEERAEGVEAMKGEEA